MQTAGAEVSGKRRNRARKGPRPITIILAAILGVISLGAVALPLLGQWPLNLGGSSGGHVISVATPQSVYARGLKVEKVGEPKKMDVENQWVVTLKVTNMVEQPPLITPTPNAPTPVPEQAKVLTGFVKVILFDAANNPVGGGNGFVRDLAYGESTQVEVVVVAYGDFTHYEAYPDAVTTDKDPVIAPGSTPNP